MNDDELDRISGWETLKKQRTHFKERLAASICEQLFGPFDRDELNSPSSTSAQSMRAACAVIGTMARMVAKAGWDECGVMKPYDKMKNDQFHMVTNFLFGNPDA